MAVPIFHVMPRTKKFDKEEILHRAVQLFWKKGFHATSMQDLVDHLGINRASLYDTYGGKESLFNQAFEQYRSSNTSGLITFLAGYNSVKEGLRALFERATQESVSDCDKKGCFIVNTTTELVPGDKIIGEALEKHRAGLENIFYEFIETGEKSGEIPKGKDLMAIARLVFMVYNGFRVVSKMNTTAEELRSPIEVALTLLD